MKKRRFWKQDSKKLNCTATIQMREVIKFPEYKVCYLVSSIESLQLTTW